MRAQPRQQLQVVGQGGQAVREAVLHLGVTSESRDVSHVTCDEDVGDV